MGVNDKTTKESDVNASVAMQAYTNVRHTAAVEGGDSHHLIHLLYQGALESIAQAKGALQQGNIELRGKKVTKAANIVMGLRDFLDTEQGGEIAQNLDALYDYIVRILWDAHRIPSEEKLNEAGRLLSEVASAWREIGGGR